MGWLVGTFRSGLKKCAKSKHECFISIVGYDYIYIYVYILKVPLPGRAGDCVEHQHMYLYKFLTGSLPPPAPGWAAPNEEPTPWHHHCGLQPPLSHGFPRSAATKAFMFLFCFRKRGLEAKLKNKLLKKKYGKNLKIWQVLPRLLQASLDGLAHG